MKIKKLLVVCCFALGIGLCSSQNTTRVMAEENEPTATLSEEENSVEVLTEEDKTQLKEVEDTLKEVFSPSNVAMYMSWVAYIVTIIGLVANIKKLKATNNLTLKNVSEEVKALLKNEIGLKVDEKFDAYLPNLIEAQKTSNKIMEKFAKILALSQENTPESRVAILNLIQELGIVANELVETSKKVVEDTQKAIEEHKEEINNQVDEIINNYSEEKYDGTSI